jgi:energy-coupling factor transport system ATP-binding protein
MTSNRPSNPAASNFPLVEVTNLCFRHPGSLQPTIEGVTLALHPGEIVLIAGATGSGKSTLLNCLAGISPSHTGGELQGTLHYQGVNIRDWSVRQRSRQFGILLQNVETQIFTDRVWEELVFGLENWNVPPEQIVRIAASSLNEFGLDAQRDWAIQRLSAGQKQRLLLACLLAMDQPILLLDEPFAYLDAAGVEQLLHLLRARADRGQSLLLVEHRLDVARAICDRAYRFQEGKLLEWNLKEQTSYKLNSASISISTDDALKDTNENSKFQASDQNIPHQVHPILLQAQQLSWGGYPPFPDLQAAAGETVLIQGHNGCGKTTFLKLLSGLLKSTTGKLEILGRDVSKRSVVRIAQAVGFVLQNPNHQLFADTVRAEVMQPGVVPEIAEALLEQLNLGDRADKHPQALSQGQKRRLALGAVLARQPRICLLDEIVVGQDPRSLQLMLTVLGNFVANGNVLVLTSHDPIAAEALNARLFELSPS